MDIPSILSQHSFQVFVFLLSILVTLQQALSSGYLNSVITTIEKRYEIPSSISGIIASMYEIGNVITVIFVSYLGSRRHIPVWLGIGKIRMSVLPTSWHCTMLQKLSKFFILSPLRFCVKSNFGEFSQSKNVVFGNFRDSELCIFGKFGTWKLLNVLKSKFRPSRV